MHIKESRVHDRFVAEPPLSANMGRSPIAICDIGAEGLQIEHSEPLRPHDQCTISFQDPWKRSTIELEARILWTRLFKDLSGRYLYRSGVKVGASATLKQALNSLLQKGAARLDDESLERKRRILEDRATEVLGQMFVRPAGVSVSGRQLTAAQIASIHHAADRLDANPDEARRWAVLARFAVNNDPRHIAIRNENVDDEFLAVWEYLDEAIAVSVIRELLENRTRRA